MMDKALRLEDVKVGQQVHMTDNYYINDGNVATIVKVLESGVKIEYVKWLGEDPLGWFCFARNGVLEGIEAL
jgi:hypothetical protein